MSKKISREEKIWRFWSRVERKGYDTCWKWNGAIEPGGYGIFNRPTQLQEFYAHRISYLLCFGPIPRDICVLHHCDNKTCTNPTHLFLGTDADNNRDMCEKGRNARCKGVKNGMAKLSDDQVREIRRRFPKTKTAVLANEFRVHPRHIRGIASGQFWRHVQ